VGTHVLTRLSVSCLSFLSSHPGASGTQVCHGLGVRHLSQVSRLLARLEAKGLIRNEPAGRGNAWSLTPEGREVLNQAQPVWAAPVAQTKPIPTPTIPA
jgi:DNA-binding MarR family transcriptional regulator